MLLFFNERYQTFTCCTKTKSWLAFDRRPLTITLIAPTLNCFSTLFAIMLHNFYNFLSNSLNRLCDATYFFPFLLLFLQLDLVRTSFSVIYHPRPLNMSNIRRTYYGHQHLSVDHLSKLSSSPIHYLRFSNTKEKRQEQSKLSSVTSKTKKTKYSKMYKLQTKFVSNGKPTNKVYGKC